MNKCASVMCLFLFSINLSKLFVSNDIYIYNLTKIGSITSFLTQMVNNNNNNNNNKKEYSW